MPTPGGGVLPTGRVRIRALTAADLIRWAYPEFRGRADQMLGTPAWANLDLFEVEAVFDPETLKQQLPVEPIGRYPGVPPAVTLMMRTLLQERFGLRTHVEERPLDVIAITLLNVDGQLGPKLRRSQSKCPTLVAGVCGIPLRNGSPRFYEAVGVPFSRFVGILEQAIDDPVRDLTGLEGLFDFELPLYSQGELPGRDSIFSVLQQQHGLSLQRRRVQGRHLVVDEIRKPSPN